MKTEQQPQIRSGHASSRTPGRRAQATPRAAATSATTPDEPRRELYQLSAGATKGNAFCWLTWKPRIGSADFTRLSANSSDEADLVPAGMAPKRRRGAARPREVTSAGRMRARLKNGPASPAELARIADLQYPAHVRSYLKRDMQAGRVVIEGGVYKLVGAKTGGEKP